VSGRTGGSKDGTHGESTLIGKFRVPYSFAVYMVPHGDLGSSGIWRSFGSGELGGE
jgi:hypothetical protein